MHTPTSMLLKAVYAACMHTKTDLTYGNAAMQFIIWSTIEQATAHSFTHAQHMNICIATCTHMCAICTGTQRHTVTNTPSYAHAQVEIFETPWRLGSPHVSV